MARGALIQIWYTISALLLTLPVNSKEVHLLHLGSALHTTGVTIQVLMASQLQLRNMFLVTLQSILITMECVLQFQRMPVRFKRFRNLKDEKSECLVHYSYVVTDHKLMLLDIQGSESTLYDPEIATEEIMDADGKEVYFCCGNCSTLAIEAFLSDHTCNKYCDMMELK